jgi:hypothetical protein
MNPRTILGISMFVLVCIIMAIPSAAKATSTRTFPASGCVPANSNVTFTSIYQWTNNLTIGNSSVICPLVSDPTVSISAGTASVTANGWDNFASASEVRVCRQPVAGGTFNCGGWSSGSSAGAWSLSPTIPTLSAGDYVFLEVSLGPPMGGGYCTFWGYTLSN